MSPSVADSSSIEVSARGVLRRRGKHLRLDDIRDFDAYDPVD